MPSNTNTAIIDEAQPKTMCAAFGAIECVLVLVFVLVLCSRAKHEFNGLRKTCIQTIRQQTCIASSNTMATNCYTAGRLLGRIQRIAENVHCSSSSSSSGSSSSSRTSSRRIVSGSSSKRGISGSRGSGGSGRNQ